MELLVPPAAPAAPPTRCPYDQATPLARTQALADMLLALAPHYPTLHAATWSQVLERVRPDLWVPADGPAYLDEEDLIRLVQYLAGAPELPPPGPPVFPDEACYLARHVRWVQRRALHALSAVEAYPGGYDPEVVELLCDLADGDGTAQRVFRLTHRPSAGPDPTTDRPAIQARLAALRQAHRASWATTPAA